MTSPDFDRAFSGSIPNLYEKYLVPFIFEPHAPDMAPRRAAARRYRDARPRIRAVTGLAMLLAVLLASAPSLTAQTSEVHKPIDVNTGMPGVLHPVGRYRLPLRGLYVQFETRGNASGYWPGQMIHEFNDFDLITGRVVKDEVALELDVMRDMGINVITYELRTADAVFVPTPFAPPACNVGPALGFQWPLPTASELANLRSFLDLLQEKGIRVMLRLVNNHMEEQPPANAATWLGAILGVIKNHPALELVLFEGNIHLDYSSCQDQNACGIPAEPSLWNGPGSLVADYIRWAMTFGMSVGMPARKLSAEAIAGAYFVDSEPGNCRATDGHLWSPIVTLKRIFDDLAIPDAQRTYALSLYEHRKCLGADSIPCTDAAPEAWAEETLQRVLGTIGTGNGSRVVVPELGANTPVESSWPTERSLESLVRLMEKYGIEGGSFWRWTSFLDSEDSDSVLADPVKKRGFGFIYNRVQKEVLDMGGLHLKVIPNGSFENGGTLPDLWSVAGAGTASRHFLAGEAGEPELPSRGSYDLRLTTGGGSSDTISARGQRLPASPNVTFTTTANLRFTWSGDPRPFAEPSTRPQVFVAIHYIDGSGRPSAIRAKDMFRFFQEDSTQGFGTFPLRYTPPPDARSVEIEIGAARNKLPTPITLDADNLR